ncbi:hypothetical protein [Planococcus sp. S3-L1]|uniref:hypothetical protein n=1 Tax=Planococcus sp. S3-L1 TaxID=3046200 RepID=UPI0024BAA1BE|nr:hypothetical protein [Planococcus sp. S3-L1]MDJ0332947.1 hypothetical protein [Planococcus sp. S3-L1]
MKKQQKWILFILLLLTMTLFIFAYFGLEEETFIQPDPQYGIFSWSSEEVTDNKKQLISNLKEYNFDRVFQAFSSSLTDEEVGSFVTDVTRNEIEVYSLIGIPEWALDASGEKMIERLERVERINRELPEDHQIKGVIVDVEPYVMDDFDWTDNSIQESYITSMKRLDQAAENSGLELIVVIPYFYDTKGYKNAVNTIISEASTETAVMNYYRDKEIDHMDHEAEQAKEANKPITTIYEFKRPGDHGLTNKNSYYNEGYLAAIENSDRLIAHYKDQPVNIAYHDYHAFKEVIENE